MNRLFCLPALLVPLLCTTLDAAVGDAVPRITAEPGTLLAGPLVPEQGRTAIIALHQGWLWTIPEVPSSAQVPGKTLDHQVRLWDIRGLDAAKPDGGMEVLRVLEPTAHPGNAHGYLQYGDVLLIGQTYRVPSYLADPATLVNDGSTRPKHTRSIYWVGRGQMTPPWGAELNWSYGEVADPTTLEFRINDRQNQDGRVTVDLHTIERTGVIGAPIILGNLLLYASDQSKTGIASYDISDPANPVLLDVLNNGEIGGYFPEVWRHYVVWPNRRNGGSFQVVDFADPTDLKLVANVDLPAGNPMYVQFQDEYAFMERYKIDMRTFEVVLTLDEDGKGVETSQFSLPVGNLLFTGGVGSKGQGLGVWVHQREPDTRGPAVGYHIPRDGQTGYPVTHSLSLLVHETLETATIVNGVTAICRPLGGAPLEGDWWFSYSDILTFVPKVDLAPDTTYEVVIPAGGIKDAAGNGIERYSFRFSTGSSVGGNRPPVIATFTADPARPAPGQSTTLSVSASDPDGGALQYRFDPGDGSAPTAWQNGATFSHSFAVAGRYRCTVQVRDAAGAVASAQRAVTAFTPPAGPRGRASAPIAIDPSSRRGWVVNPDADTVTCFDLDSLAVVWERPVAADPRSLARDGDGILWIACHDGDRVERLGGSDGARLTGIPTGYGSAPYGILVAPDGASIHLGCFGSGEVRRYDRASLAETGRVALGRSVRSLAISADGSRLFAARFHSPVQSHHPGSFDAAGFPGDDHHGEIWEVDPNAMTLVRTIRLEHDRGLYGSVGGASESTFAGRGTPNYLAALAMDPLTARLWYGAKKDNQFAGARFTGEQDDDNTVRAMIGAVDLAANREIYAGDPATGSPHNLRRDIDNSDSPSAIAFSADGELMLLAQQGIDRVTVFDRLAYDGQQDAAAVLTHLPTGAAPQGMVHDPVTGRLFVQEYLGRSVGVFDLGQLLSGGGGAPLVGRIVTVASEQLSTEVLRGKRLFHHAGDPRMSAEGYLSCATCHLDGGSDNRVWDFTARGEGLRNTIDLRGRAGLGHGRVHWSGNFDEIQDFEHDIRSAFGGTGFLSAADFAASSTPLGAAKAGRNADLDALAAYVGSLALGSLSKSPHRNTDGTMTADALAGRTVFQDQGCASCHSGATFQDSERHDVGTIGTLSGQRLGATLDGIDTPTLLGLWNNAPYFHDGSAMDLDEVFSIAGGTLYQLEDGSFSGDVQVKDNTQWPPVAGFTGSGVVQIGDSGEAVTIPVDGGQGGSAIIDLRYSSTRNQTVISQLRRYRFSCAGQSVEGMVHQTQHLTVYGHHTWSWVRVELPLPAGATSLTIEAVAGTGHPNDLLDAVVVRNASALAKAQPHRRVQALGATQRRQLAAYLLQLDGRDAQGDIPGTRSDPPRIIAGPTADPALVTGTQTTLSVTASDDGGATNLGYAWSATGPAAVAFTSNSAATTATFSAAGDYSITVTVTDSDSQSVAATTTVTVVQTASSVMVQP